MTNSSYSSSNVSPLTHSVLNIVLVLVEAILALVLRLDARLRRVVYPLVKLDTLVCIRTYLPHVQVYASFTYKGILLDTDPPKGRTPDVVINAYSHELFLALIGNSLDKIDPLQIRGEGEHIALVRNFLMSLGIGGIIDTLISKIRPKPTNPNEKASQASNQIAKLTENLNQKTQEAEALYTDNKKLSTQLVELQSKHKTTKIALIIMTIIALLAIGANFIW